MHHKFLPLLCSPATGQSLTLESADLRPNGMIESGTLVSPSGHRYPIVRGIPRFVDTEQYASSFGYEWTRWPRLQFENENVGKPMQGHTARMWDITSGLESQTLEGKTIIEFGCGPGRFLDQVRKKGGIAVGLDISMAVETARQNFENDPDVLIVQGDILKPPFKTDVFDGGYSIGVFHHTPDPSKGVSELARVVKPGCTVAVTIYPKGEFYDYPVVASLRKINNFFKPVLGYLPALAYSYLAAYVLNPVIRFARKIPVSAGFWRYMERNWLVILDLPDKRWSVLDIFDAITPAIATTHVNSELADWLENAGCSHLTTTDWCSTSIIGIKE